MPLKKKKVTNAGGKREGAGRKKIYGEDTVLAQYSVPVSKFEIFDSAATEMLEQWKIKDGEGIKAKVDRAINSGEITKISHIDKESAIKLIEDTLNDMPLLPENGVFIGRLPEPKIIVYDSENEKGVEAVFPKEENAPNIIIHESENGVRLVLGTDVNQSPMYIPKEDFDKLEQISKENVAQNLENLWPKEEQEPEKDHSEPRYSETQIESLLDTANAKYKAGKIIKEVGTNEEYRLGYNLGFNKEINSVVMGGTSIESGLYKSEVVLFSNDEWAKF